jgi:CelD/BcsL family acetyltransferase involved in cellulose biosynthesis
VLDRVAAGDWSRITLPAVPVEGGMSVRVAASLRANGWLVDQAFRERCPIIDTSASLEEYRGQLSPNARRQLKKARRRLEREGTIELQTVEEFTPDASLPEFLDECFRLEAAGWKGAGGNAVASDARLLRFWHALLERFRQTGALRVSQLRLDGALIAFCLDVLHHGRLYSMKTSYDETFAYFSPGHVLRIAMIEASIEQGIAAQELLGPMLRWKERYATDARTTVTIRGYRRRAPTAALRFAGRRYALPAIKPMYAEVRRAVNGLRGRRGAAPAQSGG